MAWSTEETRRLLMAIDQFGTKWTHIQRTYFPNRSISQIRSRYNALRKKQGEKSRPADVEPDKDIIKQLLSALH